MRELLSSGTTHDYNGEGRWSVSDVQARYVEYCRQFGVEERVACFIEAAAVGVEIVLRCEDTDGHEQLAASN